MDDLQPSERNARYSRTYGIESLKKKHIRGYHALLGANVIPFSVDTQEKLRNLEVSCDRWRLERLCRITATDMGILNGESPYYKQHQLVDSKFSPKTTTPSMPVENNLEDSVAKAYTKKNLDAGRYTSFFAPVSDHHQCSSTFNTFHQFQIISTDSA